MKMGALVALGLVGFCACSGSQSSPASALHIGGLPATSPVNVPVTFQVSALDKAGATIAGYRGTVSLSSDESGALPTTSYPFTAADSGAHNFSATFRTQGVHTVTATDGTVQAQATLTVTAPLATRLLYTDPPAGGTVRLVKNAATTDTLLVLDLVTASPVTGFAAGFNLPLLQRSIRLDAGGIVPGTALPAGSNPTAAAAALPGAGPLAGFLVSGLSQKAGGSGAVPTDSALPTGSVLYSLRIGLDPAGVAGVVFDGAAPGRGFVAAVRDHAGNDVVPFGEFRIGKLEAQ